MTLHQHIPNCLLPIPRRLAWFATLGLLLLAPVAVAQDLWQARDTVVRADAAPSPPARTDGTLRVRVDTPDGPLSLVLQANAQLGASAARLTIDSVQLHVYRGHVAGDADSWVRLSRIEGAWLGAIKTRDRLWLLDPARFHPIAAAQFGADPAGTLLFTLADVKGLQAFDAGFVRPPASTGDTGAKHGAGSFPNATSSVWQLGVTLVLDTEFQSQYGASAAAVALAILNVADGFYTTQVNTALYLHHLRLLPGNGAMTSTDSEALLNAFTQYMQTSGIPFSGVAHLLSGKDFNGSNAGLAWVGTLCSRQYGSGVDQATFSAAASGAILAHEMGHNYGANHDGQGNSCPASGYILASVLNLGNPATEFSTCSLDYFADYRASHAPACLLVLPDSIFADDFE